MKNDYVLSLMEGAKKLVYKNFNSIEFKSWYADVESYFRENFPKSNKYSRIFQSIRFDVLPESQENEVLKAINREEFFIQSTRFGIEQVVHLLSNSIVDLLKQGEIPKMPTHKDNRDVFIVHGHNNEIKESVARLVQNLNYNPIILHEQPNKGRTIIEKLEAYG